MRNTLPQHVRDAIDANLQPLFDHFAVAATQMRMDGWSDEAIEEVIEQAVQNCPGPIDPSAAAYAIKRLREAAYLEDNPASGKA